MKIFWIRPPELGPAIDMFDLEGTTPYNDGTRKELYRASSRIWDISCSEDGRRIAFRAGDLTASEFGVIDRQLGTVQTYAVNFLVEHLQISRDGAWVVYSGQSSVAQGLFLRRYDLATGSDVQVDWLSYPNQFWDFDAAVADRAISSGGRYIAYPTIQGGAFFVARLRDMTQSSAVDLAGGAANVLDVAIDDAGTRVLMLTNGPVAGCTGGGSGNNVYSQEISSGVPGTCALVDTASNSTYIRHPAISKDGTKAFWVADGDFDAAHPSPAWTTSLFRSSIPPGSSGATRISDTPAPDLTLGPRPDSSGRMLAVISGRDSLFSLRLQRDDAATTAAAVPAAATTKIPLTPFDLDWAPSLVLYHVPSTGVESNVLFMSGPAGGPPDFGEWSVHAFLSVESHVPITYANSPGNDLGRIIGSGEQLDIRTYDLP